MFGFSYDALGRRTQTTRPNYVTTSYNYDSLSRLLSVLHQTGSSTLDGAAYSLDNAGNRTSKTDLLANAITNYGYDAIYQLLSATGGSSETYTYDSVGNRLSSLAGAFSYNSSNELTAAPSASYTYDANGNMLTKTDTNGTTQYAWNFENQLTSVTLPGTGGTTSFMYDPFGRRIQKLSSLGTTNFIYDGESVISEYDSAGALLAKYTQGTGIDEPLSMLQAGTIAYYSADGLGSVTSLEDGTGSVVAAYTYDSFGNLASPEPTLMNRFRYTGREWDQETHLYYYRARYYDPSIGRFIGEDPMQFWGGIDLYLYVGSNPIRYWDPMGLETVDPQEKKNDIAQVGYWNSYKGHGFAKEALAAAQEWAKEHSMVSATLHNGAPDAFRHCFWSCTMAKYLGEHVAEVIADEHEKAGNRKGQAQEEEQMDRANNSVGRKCAAGDKNCWDACTDEYNKGSLFGLGARPLAP